MKFRISGWKTCFAVALGLAVAGTSAQVFAQAPTQGRRGGRGGAGASELMLLQNEKVQKEVELVDDQKAAIKKIGEESQAGMREMFSGMRDLSADERAKKFEELRGKMQEKQAEVTKKVEDVLLPQQKDRLKEIALQIGGPLSLVDSEAGKTLGLTDDQTTKLKEIRDDANKARGDAFQRGGTDEERTARREKADTARKEANDKALAVLTTEQREKFEKMQGKKFEIDRTELFRGLGNRRGNRTAGNTNNNN